ncbi:MAG TPA: hypothetical protein VF381_06045, partial [Thermoanaerobaculia bacterium]
MYRRIVILAVFAACALLARSVAGANPGWGAEIYAFADPIGAPGAVPGGTMRVYSLILNNGPQSASDVSITATLPELTTLVALDYIGADCSSPTPSTISCTVPSMGPVPSLGAAIAMRVTLAVDPSATADTPLPFTVYVTASNATTTDAQRTGTEIAHVL